ncbi:MAG: amino acid permease [Clostridia bacterium]|nr:amino acid permease [Clostridia bacterium]
MAVVWAALPRREKQRGGHAAKPPDGMSRHRKKRFKGPDRGRNREAQTVEGKPERTTALDRYLSPLDVWGMAFGVIIGWGVFAMPGNTFLPLAGPAGTVIAMLIGMAVMLVIGANLSYLMGRSAITGGIYSYTKEAFGRDHAFLSSWFLCLSYLTVVFLNGTALFFIVRLLLGNLVRTGIYYSVAHNVIYLSETLISVLILALVGVLFIVAKPLLLVEDNMINMEIACAILEQLGFTVDTAENGKEAVDRIASSRPGDYDLVLMDIQMPVMDGYAATRAIRELDDPALAAVPVIAMTANAFAEDVRAAENAGMDGHIAKPVDVLVLKRTVTDVLNRKSRN